MRRKGEMSPAAIDRLYPHQAALRQERMAPGRFEEVKAFCALHGAAPRGHSLVKDDEWWSVYCFADEAAALAFIDRFGAEPFNPAHRGRGPHWQEWKTL